MRTSVVAASALLLLPSFAPASPREELDLSMRVTGRTGAHDVVEAAGVGLTVALLAGQKQPRVLRAERVTLDNEPLWRVDVAGQDRDGFGCSAVAAWIAESGAVIRLGKITEIGPIDDCSQWYFDGDALAIEAVRDLDPRDRWTPETGPQYRETEDWGWDDWVRETKDDLAQPCEETGDCESY